MSQPLSYLFSPVNNYYRL